MVRISELAASILSRAEAGLQEHQERGGEMAGALALGELEAALRSLASIVLSKREQDQVERVIALVNRCTYPLEA